MRDCELLPEIIFYPAIISGTADFVPAQITAHRIFTPGSFETFGANIAKVNTWIAQQPPNLNICNVQSIDYKVEESWGEYYMERTIKY